MNKKSQHIYLYIYLISAIGPGSHKEEIWRIGTSLLSDADYRQITLAIIIIFFFLYNYW